MRAFHLSLVFGFPTNATENNAQLRHTKPMQKTRMGNTRLNFWAKNSPLLKFLLVGSQLLSIISHNPQLAKSSTLEYTRS